MNKNKPNDICQLCKKEIMTNYKKLPNLKWFEKHDTVHVKCGNWLDEIFHYKCWNNLKIDQSAYSIHRKS